MDPGIALHSDEVARQSNGCERHYAVRRNRAGSARDSLLLASLRIQAERIRWDETSRAADCLGTAFGGLAYVLPRLSHECKGTP